MEPKTQTALINALAPCLLLIAACAGNQPEPQPVAVDDLPDGHFYVGKTEVFAELVRDRGGSWILKGVHDSEAAIESGYPVRLNDLTPAFDIRAVECTPQIYPEGHRCSPTHPFRDKDSGVIDKIINSGVAVGTAGKVTEISQTYETTFDETAFNRAVDEALINSNLEGDRRRLIQLLDAYDTEYSVTRAALVTEMKDALASGADMSRVEVDYEPRISGILEYYGGDLDLDGIVTMRLENRPRPEPVDIERRDILPCNPGRCIGEAEAALTALRQEAANYRRELRELAAPSNVTYGVSCRDGAYEGYLLATECPEQIVVEEGTAVLPVDITILARDFEALYPSFSLSDERISVEVEGARIRFTNLTREYLEVTAVTVYYNSRTHTTPASINVPPGISVDGNIDDFVSRAIEIESTYRQMTPDRAAGTSFRFGLAVRYRSGESTEVLTLHAVDEFSADCVIENRIRPGSCRQESRTIANKSTRDAPTGDETIRDELIPPPTPEEEKRPPGMSGRQ